VTWDGATPLCMASSNATGSFGCNFTVPNGVAGAHNVTATQGNASSSTPFRVEPRISLSASAGAVGFTLTVTGAGFDASTSYSVAWNATTTFCSALSTSSTGGVDCSFAVPPTPAGPVEITAHEGTYAPTATFSVGPSLTLSPSSGSAGGSANASGAGFDANATYTVSWDTGAALCAGVTNSVGGFLCSFTVPGGSGGAHTVTAVEGALSATATFTLGQFLSLSASSGKVGSAVTVSGGGFGAGTIVSVAWNATTALCSATADGSGDFGCTFTVPPSPGGLAMVNASGGGHSASVSFSVVANLALSPASGVVGASVSAVGSGYGASSAYSVDWNATTVLCAGTTNSNGGFSCSFTVPAAATGSYTISTGSGAPTGSFTVTGSGPSNNSPPASAFPWWEVAVFAALAVAILLVALVLVRRRRAAGPAPARPSSPPAPWSEDAVAATGRPYSPSAADTTPGAAPAAAAATPTAAEPVADIDVLIDRLEQMSLEMFKKTPKQLSEETPDDEGK
jgi:hypothetical protein